MKMFAAGGWFSDLFRTTATDGTVAVAHAVLVLGLAIASGLALGRIKIFGISLGIGGVLFSGIALSHFGMKIHSHEVLHFVREFGLILFVFTIGLQVGPGFLGSLRKTGLPLNLMAASVVVLGVVVTLLIVQVTKGTGREINVPVAVGLLSGGTTNTPSLAAAQEAIREVEANRNLNANSNAASTMPASEASSSPAKMDSAKSTSVAYALAYPFGILGIIGTMLIIRAVFRVDMAKENALFATLNKKGAAVETQNLELTNPNLDGMKLGELSQFSDEGVVVSRVMRGGESHVANDETVLRLGDVLHIVGVRDRIEKVRPLVGKVSTADVIAAKSGLGVTRMVVTRGEVIGKTLAEIDLTKKFDAIVTRVSRMEVEIAATPAWRLQFGDVLTAVGSETALKRAGEAVGNSVKSLDHPHLIPIFLGIALGVIVGSFPIPIPGVPSPVKLGLAGGPLLVAILLSRVGQIGPLSWYMPRSANLALREMGIVLFLACVGLIAGEGMVEQLVHGDGLYWMGMAAMITLLPLLVVGFAARIIFKVNFVSICGVLAGSMTDPPALAFANQISGGEAPSVSYATVYPLTMLLRVVAAQAIVLSCW